MTILVHNDGPVRVIEFNHKSTANPFSRAMQLAVTQAVRDASSDESVKAVIFYGGKDRFFSAGGDFNEVKNIQTIEEVDDWIDTFMDMYLSILTMPQPTLSAIEGYAIGIGFQVSLMTDWRVMSDQATVSMPELRHGIGGSVGGAILTALFGAEAARETMLGALDFKAEEALSRHFVQEVVPHELLMERALARAHERTTFPAAAYSSSKKAINASVEATLRQSIESSKQVHRASFQAKAMLSHMNNILERGKGSADETKKPLELADAS